MKNKLSAFFIIAGILSATDVRSDQLPRPDLRIRELVCKWDSAGQLDLKDRLNPRFLPEKLEFKTFFPESFKFQTDGMRIFNISLPRWKLVEEVFRGSEKVECSSSLQNIACTTGRFTITLDRDSLLGVEVSTIEMGLGENGRSSIFISNFHCNIVSDSSSPLASHPEQK